MPEGPTLPTAWNKPVITHKTERYLCQKRKFSEETPVKNSHIEFFAGNK
jgi:hypothetical protein